ncbi:hypothetical protein TrVE_jg3698 [Triparma verrucosa]|uniref:MaoC-like domain-containing protein n=1 Tax=Triparma verrucosa TaxID=1606542 RepID=A0A9W6ZBR8_9STRA|nr:hypothetical protein TrVE_jg3698 [Triparma verrucosa]
MSKLPSLASIYVRAAASIVKSTKLKKGVTTVPPITLHVDDIGPFTQSHVDSFKSQVSIKADTSADTSPDTSPDTPLPSTYLQCVTMPMPMEILSRTDFNILGSLHESCTIKSHRKIQQNEKLSAFASLVPEVEFSDKNDVLLRIGVEINDSENNVVQTIDNQYRILNPQRHKIKSTPKPASPDYSSWPTSYSFSYPVTAGRTYASLNGDVNPIHVSPLAARLFGYSSCIAHGMFSVCNLFHASEDDTGVNTIVGEFVRPVVLPRDVVGKRKGEEYVVGFYDKEGKFKVCVKGVIKDKAR